jgi:hypothetical protein
MNAVRTVQRSRGHGAVLLAIALAATATSGCKSGSWGAKPSWWTLGGTGTTDPANLAAAPSFSDDVTKPSSTAKPYPTTSTPEGYVLANAETAGAAVPAPGATAPAAITYGSTPPPAAAAPTAIAAGSPATATQPGLTPPLSPLSSIAPQVGPYAAPANAGPPESVLPSTPGAGLAAVPAAQAAAPTGSAFSSPPASFDPAARVADARGGSSWPATAPSATDPNASRYGAATGSRFSGPAGAADPLPTQPAQPTWTPSAIDAAPAAAPVTPAPAAFTPPPAAAAPSTPPARRPDPGYRPGGTSSYRSSRDMLGGEGSIQPVSFDSPPPTAP